MLMTISFSTVIEVAVAAFALGVIAGVLLILVAARKK
jgi:hypothetical protein